MRRERRIGGFFSRDFRQTLSAPSIFLPPPPPPPPPPTPPPTKTIPNERGACTAGLYSGGSVSADVHAVVVRQSSMRITISFFIYDWQNDTNSLSSQVLQQIQLNAAAAAVAANNNNNHQLNNLLLTSNTGAFSSGNKRSVCFFVCVNVSRYGRISGVL